MDLPQRRKGREGTQRKIGAVIFHPCGVEDTPYFFKKIRSIRSIRSIRGFFFCCLEFLFSEKRRI
jgi:hypothetical protein